MTAPNLIAIVGAGGALTLAGFGLLGAAAGVALYSYFPGVSLAVWLLIFGVVMLILGLTLVERGGTKTVEKVENELSMPNVVQNFPWTFVGIGAGAALLVYWMFRRPAPKEVTRTEIKYVPAPMPDSGSSGSTFFGSQPSAPKRMTLSDVLVPLGSAAASYATTVGMKALGIPSPKDLLGSLVSKFMSGGPSALFGSSSSKSGSPTGSDGARPHNGYESAMRRS